MLHGLPQGRTILADLMQQSAWEWYIGYSYSREAIRKWDSISVTGVAAGYG